MDKLIGLIDVDCHAGKKKWGATVYPNLALGKLCAWHRAHGDTVQWAVPILLHYDIIYRSKLFNFTPDDDGFYDADEVVKGGTGYSLTTSLSQEVDDMQPDFSIYPYLKGDVAYGFLTRGCPNRCPWCVVPDKEGMIRPYWDIERVLNGKRKAVLMDNNILAAGDYGMEQLDKIVRLGVQVDFNQALDARLVNEDNARLLAQIRWLENRRIRFGCGTPAQIAECERAMDLIDSFGFKGQYFLYTMIGHTSFREAYERINHWRERNLQQRRERKGNIVYPYAQPYRDPHLRGGGKLENVISTSPDGATRKTSSSLSRSRSTFLGEDSSAETISTEQAYALLSRWTNKRMYFDSCEFKNFRPSKNVDCGEILKTIK